MALTAYTVVASTSGAVNTKGAYTQIVASTPYDSSRLFLIAEFGNAGARLILMDIATGGVGTETVIIANLAVYIDFDAIASGVVPLNVNIPAGTRLSVRVQSLTASTVATSHFYLENRALASLVNPVTYGADIANSRGTQVDPGGTINTKGVYVQLIASTSSRIDSLVVCVTVLTQAISITAALRWSIDIATGASGSEVIVLPDITLAANNSCNSVRPGLLYFPVSIPAGTRIAVRCSCISNNATQRLIAVTLLGMQEPASGGGSSEFSQAFVG